MTLTHASDTTKSHCTWRTYLYVCRYNEHISHLVRHIEPLEYVRNVLDFKRILLIFMLRCRLRFSVPILVPSLFSHFQFGCTYSISEKTSRENWRHQYLLNGIIRCMILAQTHTHIHLLTRTVSRVDQWCNFRQQLRGDSIYRHSKLVAFILFVSKR